MEHNIPTYHHAIALGGLTRRAAPKSQFIDSTPLSSQPFPADVILRKTAEVTEELL
jgi:hypothetical protein